jgi:hypothetical protein
MKINELETRTKWLTKVDNHSYIREKIQWTNGSIVITWNLNEDSTQDYEPLTDEQLEKLFLENNNNPVL